MNTFKIQFNAHSMSSVDRPYAILKLMQNKSGLIKMGGPSIYSSLVFCLKFMVKYGIQKGYAIGHICVHISYIYVQTMDMDNPWIACSIHRSGKTKGTEHGFGQSSDTDIRLMAGCLSEQELPA